MYIKKINFNVNIRQYVLKICFCSSPYVAVAFIWSGVFFFYRISTMTKRAINETNPEKSTASYTGNKVEKANLKGDWLNLYLLVIFYTMQGFPYGISLALPIIFQSKKVVTYEEQVKRAKVGLIDYLTVWRPYFH